MKNIELQKESLTTEPLTSSLSKWLSRTVKGTVALVTVLFFSQIGVAQTITNLYVSDSTFVVPAGVTTITVETWGGGGRGGSRTSGSGAYGGGGGGAYSRSVLAVTPGHTNTIKIGVGATSNSSPGGDSWFSTNGVVSGAVVLAKGGQTVPNNSANGANGGSASSGIGDVRYSGGNGANGSGSNAGGGGSSAGVSANGVNGSGSTGGIAPAGGGDGGNGRSGSQGNGDAGSVPGGGGGGAYRTSGTRSGGNGANGRVQITYVRQPAKIVFLTPPRVMIANTVSASITVQLRDAGNNEAQSIGDTVINLNSSESGTFRDQTDSYDITSVAVSNGQSTATFVYRSGVIGTHVLMATDAASVLTQDSQNLIVKDVSTQPAPVQIFYMPVPEAQMLTMFNTLHSTPQNPVYRYAGITVSSTNTLIYYDQMEDGYEAQIHNPVSIYHPISNPSGTQIWGDGDLSNGVAPGFANDIIPPRLCDYFK